MYGAAHYRNSGANRVHRDHSAPNNSTASAGRVNRDHDGAATYADIFAGGVYPTPQSTWRRGRTGSAGQRNTNDAKRAECAVWGEWHGWTGRDNGHGGGWYVNPTGQHVTTRNSGTSRRGATTPTGTGDTRRDINPTRRTRAGWAVYRGIIDHNPNRRGQLWHGESVQVKPTDWGGTSQLEQLTGSGREWVAIQLKQRQHSNEQGGVNSGGRNIQQLTSGKLWHSAGARWRSVIYCCQRARRHISNPARRNIERIQPARCNYA